MTRLCPTKTFLVLLSTPLLLALIVLTGPAQEKPALLPRERWTSLFGGQEVVYHFTVPTPGGVRGTLGWRLAVEQRTLARGEVPVTVEGNQPGAAAIKLPLPEVKNGVILQTQLTVALLIPSHDRPLAELTKTLWIFPANPFTDRERWLKELKITLFDPRGKTAEVLQKMQVPFEEVRNTAALSELKEGFLLVGEGVSWKEERDLPQIMTELAARNVSVLCLAPADGTLTLPSAPLVPRGLAFKRQEVIAQLDKRLDTAGWPPDGEMVASSLVLRGEGAGVVAEATPGAAGWPWMELELSTGGKLVICGFGLISKWDAAPTPRYLFRRLLEHTAGREGETRLENSITDYRANGLTTIPVGRLS